VYELRAKTFCCENYSRNRCIVCFAIVPFESPGIVSAFATSVAKPTILLRTVDQATRTTRALRSIETADLARAGLVSAHRRAEGRKLVGGFNLAPVYFIAHLYHWLCLAAAVVNFLLVEYNYLQPHMHHCFAPKCPLTCHCLHTLHKCAVQRLRALLCSRFDAR